MRTRHVPLIAVARTIFGLLTVVALALSPWASGHVAAETPLWSGPVNVSDGVTGWFPAIAADNSGQVHLVWSGDPDTKDAPSVVDGSGANATDAPASQILSGLMYSRGDGTKWTQPNDVAVIHDIYALRSSLTVDSAGQLHLLYKGLGTLAGSSLSQQDIWYTSANGQHAESVHAWDSPTRFTRSREGYYSAIALDHHGTIHTIWTESGKGKYDLFYAHSTDGGATWSQRLALDSGAGDSVWWYRAQLKVDMSDRLHVTWEQIDSGANVNAFGETALAVYARSIDGGANWIKTKFPDSSVAEVVETAPSASPTPIVIATPIASPTPGSSPQQPSIGIDGTGRVVLVYREPRTDHVMYRFSDNGATWSEPTTFPGIKSGVRRPYDIYDMATDSAGHIHVVMIAYSNVSTKMAVLHSEWDGSTWTVPDVIDESPPYPEYPRIAIGNGNQLHVAWFSGDDPSVNRRSVGIWYSHAATNAPRVDRWVMPANPRPLSNSEGVLALPVTVSATEVKPLAKPTSTTGTSPSTVPSDWIDSLSRRPETPLALGSLAAVALLSVVWFIRQIFTIISHLRLRSNRAKHNG